MSRLPAFDRDAAQPRVRRLATRLAGDRRGATIMEFAIVLMPFMILIMGSMDIAYQIYLRALTTGALERAAREATVGNRTKAQVVDLIRNEVRTIMPNGSKYTPDAIQVKPLSYYNFSSVNRGERITGDTAPVGVYNKGDCYEDRNANGAYDATNGGGDDLGTSDDILYYNVTVTVPRLFPLARMIGWSPNVVVGAQTLIRNQPYGQQQVKILCS